MVKLLEHPAIGALATYLRKQEEGRQDTMRESIEHAQRQLASRRRRPIPTGG